jgi:uncharacterized membrane protein
VQSSQLSVVVADGIYGVQRVSRHANFWSLGLLGLGSALATPFAPEIIFFSMPAVFAGIGGAHQDYRFRKGSGGHLDPEIDRKTCNVPFVALVTGKQSWAQLYEDMKVTNAIVATSAALLLHARRVVR